MEKPAVVYDGECRFCCRWVEKWRQRTGAAFDFYPFQEVAERFLQIPQDNFAKSIHLIQPDRSFVSGAEAIFAVYAAVPRRKLYLRLYRYLPGFRWCAEWVYRWVASHRQFISHLEIKKPGSH